MNAHLRLGLIGACLVLTACAKGLGSDPLPPARPEPLPEPDPRAARLVGRWVDCWSARPGTTEKEEMRITSAGGMKLRLSRMYVRYADSSDCTGGTSYVLQEEDSELTLLGQTWEVAGHPLERFSRVGRITDYAPSPMFPGSSVAVPRPAPLLGVLGVIESDPPTLRMGDDEILDAQGLPAVMTPLVYSRRPS